MTRQAADATLGFVHIPKNAGTSIRQAILDHALPIALSGHAYPVKKAEREIVVLRDPIERFVSAFNYGRTHWPNRVNRDFASADELAISAGDPDHPKHDLAWVELGNKPEHYLQRSGKAAQPQTVAGRVIDFPWVYEPQSSWLINDPAHILRYRHLAADFSALLLSLGLPGEVNLARENRGDVRGERLSDAAIAFLERTYARDFEFIRMHGLDV